MTSFYRRAFRIENTLRKYFTPNELVRFQQLQGITGEYELRLETARIIDALQV